MAATNPHIILTVTNDLSFDQRMHRICGSLAKAGYQVTLVGRQLHSSLPLTKRNFAQERIQCRFEAGKLFYAEYNWRLFRHLQKKVNQLRAAQQVVAICAIDLDTILPCHRIARKFGLAAVYDAHELFSELTEVKRRPVIHALWLKVEKAIVPHFTHGYTVNQFIADELQRRYGVQYEVIRNMPVRTTGDRRQTTEDGFNANPTIRIPGSPFFLYQGAVNEGRSFETLIPAMKKVHAPLVIAGEGNFFEQAKTIARENGLEEKVIFLGYVPPDQLKMLTPKAFAGMTIFENTGLNQYYSLANRFFDYIQAGIPQICVNYPEYAALNQQFETAYLTDEIGADELAEKMNHLLSNDVLYNRLKANCGQAGQLLCWEEEEKKLLTFWKKIVPLTNPLS